MPEDVFEEYAEDYDRWFDEHPAEYHAELARIQRLLPAPGPRAIEVGTGSGRFATPLGIALGIEPSRMLGRMARQRGMEILQARGEAIPLKDSSSSSALMVTVICFLEDPVPVFRELSRILVPEGIMVLAFIERGGLIHQKYLREGGKGRFLSRARFYSAGEVQALIEISGLLVIEVESRAGFCVITARKG